MNAEVWRRLGKPQRPPRLIPRARERVLAVTRAKPALRSHRRKWSVSSGWTWRRRKKKKNLKHHQTWEKPSEAITACRVGEGGRVWTNNHKQLCSRNLIKLLMTCHSRALQMFIDAHYQPHSSSVRVAALAAMSPTTPTHLVLPPHRQGWGWGGGGEGLKRSTSFQDADGGCWAVTPCFLRNQQRGQLCDYLFIRSPPPTLNHPPTIHAIMFGTRRDTFTEPLPPVPLPFAMWKQPFSRGHFLGFHPDAWHSWQIGCGSEGDGLWKQCPCLQPTHCRRIHKGMLTRRYMSAARVCVRNLTLAALGRPARPWRQSGR